MGSTIQYCGTPRSRVLVALYHPVEPGLRGKDLDDEVGCTVKTVVPQTVVS